MHSTTIDKAGFVRRHKPALLGGLLILCVGLGAMAVMRYQAADAVPPSGAQWLAVQVSPLSHQIGLVGKIEPQKTITLTAPFDGNVLANRVELGQQVEAGQILLQMDPSLLQIQLREALSSKLKAQRAVQELQDWNNSQQVGRARRTLRASEMTLSNSERKHAESKQLFARGIVARNELDDLTQQLQTQRLDLQAAQAELQQTLAQGKGEYLQIAEMELTNASVKYQALLNLLEGQNLRAPFAGIVVPAADGSDGQNAGAAALGPVQDGARVSQGQVLFGLANIERLKIVSKVSELDINQLHPGQNVEILGDGFAGERLKGTVDIVSSLATPGDSSGSSARFPVTLSIPKLTPEQQQRVRLGMSARLTIVTYQNDQAIIVPPAAIQRSADGMHVEYRQSPEQPIQRLPVTTGKSTAEGVEVFGLQPGMVHLPE